jgi:hypothetical protein
MHGSYPHRVACNLHTDQYHRLRAAADAHRAALAPFLRDAAIAYLDQRFRVPEGLQDVLTANLQEVRRIGTNLNQIAAKANTQQRVTRGDLRQAKRAAALLEDRIRTLEGVIASLKPAT